MISYVFWEIQNGQERRSYDLKNTNTQTIIYIYRYPFTHKQKLEGWDGMEWGGVGWGGLVVVVVEEGGGGVHFTVR